MYEEILNKKKLSGLNWFQLAEDLPIKGDSLRISFVRKKVDPDFLKIVVEKINKALKKTDHEPIKLIQENEDSLTEEEVEDFINKLFTKKKDFKNHPLYIVFEQEIRLDERKKTIIDYFKNKMANE